ncbi:hypothetical protein JVU11DRAFT_7103 [Chiua virens]|nr:hypothetical protein JVU11DRAFT_7103 [Chiua virens]
MLCTAISLFSCKVWYAITISVGMLSIAISNFLVLLRLWVLWGRCPRLIIGTLVFFIATQCVSLSLLGYVIHKLLPTLEFNPRRHICAPVTRAPFVLLWSPGMAFELMIFFTMLWNALDRPRSRKTGVAKILYRDGSLFFLVLFVSRLLNMLVSIIAPASLLFVGVFFIWSISNITLSRLVLKLRRLSTPAVDDEQEDAETALEDVEHTELPVLPRHGSGGGQSDSDPESPHKLVL